MKILSPLIAIVSLVFISCSSDGTSPSATTTYIENASINVGNPDRGFYRASYELNKETDYNMFESVKESGHTLAYGVVELDDYAQTTTLPTRLLSAIDKNFQDAESMNIKLILRIIYRDSGGEDTEKEIIQAHLSQLKSTLQNHKEIISVVQAGLIGPWGEWHSFSGDYADSSSGYLQNRRDIITALVDIFPDKYIQIRTPMHKEQLYGSALEYRDVGSDAKITSEIAFSDDIRAKLGHHNDCFLTDEGDNGTYASDNITFWREYVQNDSKYSPLGGETCEDNAEFTNCSYALEELESMQWSYINESFDEDVIQRWKDGGCYEEIQENLGYRLVAKELYLDQSDTTLSVKLNIENKGYSAPYIKSDIIFLLKDVNTTQEYSFEEESVDLRTFYPQETKAINSDIQLNGVKQGEYCLYIQLTKEYADIKLSNSNLWDEDTQSNLLGCDIIIE